MAFRGQAFEAIAESGAVVSHQMSDAVAAAVAGLGRTEDIRFSPDGSRIAVAGYSKGVVLLLDVRLETDRDAAVDLFDFMEFSAPGLREPHGFDFAGNEILVVADRRRVVTLYRIPSGPGRGRRIELSPIRKVRKAGRKRKIHSPGSAVVSRHKAGSIELMVCNNYRHRITRHRFRLGWSPRFDRHRTVLSAGLEVPDGIAVSPDRRWLAVSNHMTGEVLIYDTSRRLTEDTTPVGRMSGVAYPHGIRFTPDGTWLIAAEAGAPHIKLFHAADGRWAGDHRDVDQVCVLPEAVFDKGQVNKEEGGPKGLDIDSSGRLLAVSNELQPLLFLDLERLLA